MKKVYLGFFKVEFNYSTMDELRKKATEFNINIGNDSSILSFVKFGISVKLQNNCSIDFSFTFNNLYKYDVSGFYEKTSKKYYIQLGCYTRTIEEWESDFHNNDEEFPKGANQTKKRLKAYRLMKDLILNYRGY